MSKRKSRNDSVPANQPKYEGRNNRKGAHHSQEEIEPADHR